MWTCSCTHAHLPIIGSSTCSSVHEQPRVLAHIHSLHRGNSKKSKSTPGAPFLAACVGERDQKSRWTDTQPFASRACPLHWIADTASHYMHPAAPRYTTDMRTQPIDTHRQVLENDVLMLGNISGTHFGPVDRTHRGFVCRESNHRSHWLVGKDYASREVSTSGQVKTKTENKQSNG